MTLLEKIDYLMKKYDLNKNTLSKKSGIKYTTLDSLYKKGYSNVKLSTLMALARYFNVSLDYLVKDEIRNPRYGFDEIYSEKELKVLELYRLADRDTQRAIELILGYKSEYANKEDNISVIAAHPTANPDAGDSDFIENDQADMDKKWD